MDAVEHALDILGLGPDAKPQDVKQAYRDLVKVWHPDRFPNDSRVRRKAEEKLKEINEAYRTLQDYDPDSRARFRTHGGPTARPKPTQNHRETDPPSHGSPSPPFESSGKSEPGSPAPVPEGGANWQFRWGVWIFLMLILAVGRGYLNESRKTENHPRPAATTYVPSMRFPKQPSSSISPSPEASKPTSFPTALLREGVKRETVQYDAKFYVSRGQMYADSGQHSAAIADYDRAIRLNPDDAGAYIDRGLSKGKLGKHFSAIADFDLAIRLKPSDGLAYYNRGAAKHKLGRIREAKQDFITALELAANDGNESLIASIEQIIRNFY